MVLSRFLCQRYWGRFLNQIPDSFVDRTMTVNFYTSQAIGVPMRYSLITTTEFVGDYRNPLAVRTYALPDLIDEALAANLFLESEHVD